MRVDINDLKDFAGYWLYDYNYNYNCWWWDWSDDGIIDFNDLDMIMEYWLWPYDFGDFADFAQYWRRAVDYRFTDRRFDLVPDNLVNFRDFAKFAQQWRQETNGPNPSITITVSGDVNRLSGDVSISMNIPDNTITRIFLLVDGRKYAEYRDIEENPIEILKTQYYQNGRHEIKIAEVDVNHIVYCSELVDVNFQNIISSLSKESYFTPGQPLRIKAFGQGNFNVSVYDIINETVTYSGVSNSQINIAIPAEAFPEEYGVYDLTLSSQDYPSSPPVKSLARRNPVPKWATKMVVSIADEELQNAKRKCWRGALMAGVRKGFAPAVIVPEDGDEWFNYLTRVISSHYCKIWYHLGHGNYRTMLQPWNPDRTFLATPSGPIFSYLKKDLNPVPPNYQTVWGYEGCHSIAELGLANTDKMIWVQINACYSARNPDFMTYVGIPPNADPLVGKHIYIGWNDTALVYDLIGKYNQFEEQLWEYLRMGYNLQDAYDEATIGPGWNQIESNFRAYGVISWQYVWFRYPWIN